jgi:predicted nucleotidyltransferase
MDPSKRLQDNREEILRIATAHGAQNVRVFGSVSRGEASSKSDVDFLVKLESGRSLLDLIAIKQDLEDLLGCAVDVVTEDAVSPYIREQVLKEAVGL